jgi:hypothetical protein
MNQKRMWLDVNCFKVLINMIILNFEHLKFFKSPVQWIETTTPKQVEENLECQEQSLNGKDCRNRGNKCMEKENKLKSHKINDMN